MMGRIGLVVAAVGVFAFAGSALAGPGGCFVGAHTAQSTPPPVLVLLKPPVKPTATEPAAPTATEEEEG